MEIRLLLASSLPFLPPSKMHGHNKSMESLSKAKSYVKDSVNPIALWNETNCILGMNNIALWNYFSH
jgi:hypothetical protein